MNGLDEWADALYDHDRPLRKPITAPTRRQRRVSAQATTATLIMGLYDVWCGECGQQITDRMPDDEIACPDCGADFFFIKPSQERLLPEDHRAIQGVANATGLQLIS